MRTVSADRHAVEGGLQLAPRQLVFVAMEPDRGLPDALDQVEHVGALLVAHGIAEDAPEQPDVVPQPGIFLALSSTRLVADSASEGTIWGDIGCYSRSCPASPECAIFLPQRKIKMEAARPFFVVPARSRDDGGSI